MNFSFLIRSGYPRPLPPLLLPLLAPPLEPDDRDGGDTDPRERPPDDLGGATLRGRDGRDGRALLGLDGLAGRALAGLAGRDGLALAGLAGRALLPAGRRVDEGRTPVDGRREVPDGRTARPEGRRDVPLRMPSVFRVPRVVVPGRTAPRVPVRTPEPLVPRVATVRVEMRPFASRDIAVRVAERVEARDVRVFIRSRDDERATIRRLLTMIAPG